MNGPKQLAKQEATRKQTTKGKMKNKTKAGDSVSAGDNGISDVVKVKNWREIELGKWPKQDFEYHNSTPLKLNDGNLTTITKTFPPAGVRLSH